MSIVVADFHKSYDQTIAVAGISFQVEAGEILGLVGPNGAGKTTTLRALAGILRPTKGALRIAGHDLATEAVAAKAAMAYVPDDPRLFDELTVWEHFRFIASAYRVQDWRERAEELLERFELTEKRDTVAAELSRGMRQKLAICCGYLHQPRVFLLDEPLTGLDPHGIRTMKESIRAHAAAGTAFIVSSHLLSLIEDLCTSVLIYAHDFRRDYDRMEVFKTLPIRSANLVLGQVLTPVLCTALMQTLGVFALVMAGADTLAAVVVLGSALLLGMPLSLLVVLLDNMVFLLSPSRPIPTPGSQFSGLKILLNVGKVLVLYLACAIAGGVGTAAYFLAGRQFWLAAIVAGLVLGGFAAALLPLAALLFRRFDVARERSA